jgi:phosphate:Na+ symporter
MSDILKEPLKKMSKIIVEMVDIIEKGLMENDIHILDGILERERAIDASEKDIAANIAKLAKDFKEKGKQKLVILGQIAESLERMGDELSYLVERIELKISEKLRFSEAGITQYKEVFEKMRTSVNLIVEFLDKDNTGVLDEVIKNGDEMKELVEKYRAEHIERLAKGICDPRASNMYSDMLDFTGNVARHCTNIAKISKEW